MNTARGIVRRRVARPSRPGDEPTRVRRVRRVVRHQRREDPAVGDEGCPLDVLGAERRGFAVERATEIFEFAPDGGPHDVVGGARRAQVLDVDWVYLSHAMRAILRLEHRGGDPVQLPEHHVRRRREREPLPARLYAEHRHAQRVLLLKPPHGRRALQRRRGAVHPNVRHASRAQRVLHRVKHHVVVREEQKFRAPLHEFRHVRRHVSSLRLRRRSSERAQSAKRLESRLPRRRPVRVRVGVRPRRGRVPPRGGEFRELGVRGAHLRRRRAGEFDPHAFPTFGRELIGDDGFEPAVHVSVHQSTVQLLEVRPAVEAPPPRQTLGVAVTPGEVGEAAEAAGFDGVELREEVLRAVQRGRAGE